LHAGCPVFIIPQADRVAWLKNGPQTGILSRAMKTFPSFFIYCSCRGGLSSFPFRRALDNKTIMIKFPAKFFSEVCVIQA
jgi:hypothetical protein